MIDNYFLSVSKIVPGNHSTRVNVNSNIEIHFNLELNTDSALSNIYVLKDKDRILLQDKIVVEREKIVQGSFSYKDKVMYFKPQSQLEEDCRYIIFVEKDIVDISNRCMAENFVGAFETENYGSLKPCKVIYPKDNSLIKELKTIEVEELNTSKYVVQISKSKEFERIYKEYVKEKPLFEIDNLPSGTFFLRAKGIDGDFGETIFFTIKAFENTLICNDDPTDDLFYEFEEIESDNVALVKTVPDNNSINISPFTNLFYFEVDGLIEYSSIDIYSIMIEENFIDSDDIEKMSDENYKDFTLNYLYDDKNNKTILAVFLKEL